MNFNSLKRKRVIIPAVAVLAVLGAGAGAAVATDNVPGRDSDNLTGTTLDRASQAALAEVGDAGARVTGAETSDHDDDPDEAREAGEAYEVEVTRADGTEVDVSLDDSFQVVRSEADGQDDDTDEADDSDDADDAGDADDRVVPDAERRKAERAALAAVPGTVTSVEHETPDAADTGAEAQEAYHVEVTADDGTQWDIGLDAGFTVLTKHQDR